MENKALTYFSDMSCRFPHEVKPHGHQSLFVVRLKYQRMDTNTISDLSTTYGNFRLANARMELELACHNNALGSEQLTDVAIELISVYDGRVVGRETLIDKDATDLYRYRVGL